MTRRRFLSARRTRASGPAATARTARAALASVPVVLLLCGLAWAGETLSGRATVIDGDTLRIGGTVIGLAGVAAPGLDQTCESRSGGTLPCGVQAARALAERIGEGVVACETRGLDGTHRTLAVCRLGEEDLNAWMVSGGLAVSERFSDAAYFAHETRAWGKRRGLWAGVFDDPTGRRRVDYAQAAVTPSTKGEPAARPADMDAAAKAAASRQGLGAVARSTLAGAGSPPVAATVRVSGLVR